MMIILNFNIVFLKLLSLIRCFFFRLIDEFFFLDVVKVFIMCFLVKGIETLVLSVREKKL
jgi:hypothetical protein